MNTNRAFVIARDYKRRRRGRKLASELALEIAADLAAYLAAGHQIRICLPGETGDQDVAEGYKAFSRFTEKQRKEAKLAL